MLSQLPLPSVCPTTDWGSKPDSVTVPSRGTYQLEIDYQTSGVRSFFLSINDGAPIQLDLNGGSFDDPAVTIIPVQLNAGVNTMEIGNPSGYAPDLDRIVVAPPIPQTAN